MEKPLDWESKDQGFDSSCVTLAKLLAVFEMTFFYLFNITSRLCNF